MKRLSILLVLAMLFTAGIASANPFSDVPFSHWAYDAVNKLAAKGILQGYPDGTFKGRKPVTRYALAMVVAKMLANVEQMLESGVGTNLVTKSDLQTLEKLTVEFADELALLGVKVTALEDDMQVVKEDVSMLKRDVAGIKDYMAKGGMEKVKLSGDMLVRHTNLTHKDDWATSGFGVLRAGNSDNVLTESQIRFKFKANIDENITAVARWSLFAKHLDDVNSGQSWNNGTFGLNGIGANTVTDNVVDLAYLKIKDMFRFGGDFTFGRNFYTAGHGMLLNDYVDAIRYYKRSGDVDVVFQTIYDRHMGNYKDNGPVDFRTVWNLDLSTKYKDHDLYLNWYYQDEPNLINDRAGNPLVLTPYPAFALSGTAAGAQDNDTRWDIEFGAKGPIGNSGHWDYDLGFVYTDYQMDVNNTAASPFNMSPEMQGWMGYGAVKWDSKKQWAAKLAYAFADDESMGAYALDNDQRYQDGIETPYEDISRGNTWFANGLTNMYDAKLQVEYRPRDSKHYFRLAGDWLDELDDTVTNDLAKWSDATVAGQSNVAVPAVKTNTVYDRWNNLGVAEPEAFVLTFEYRYQLAENTRIRLGYTQFDFTGDAVKRNGATANVSAGRGWNNDYDYNMFWAEIYSQF